jgi:DNA-binding transcriptional regulator of glucitol operon
MKIVASRVVLRIVVWIREFLLVHTQIVRYVGQFSEEVRIASVVIQGIVLGPLVFLAYVNDIWKNNESTIKTVRR